MATNTDIWCQGLENRFREAPTVALSKLENLRYSVADVRARKDPEEYIQQVVINGKNAGTATTETAQVMMAYNHLDVQLRILLPQPALNTTLSEFMVYVQKAKANWFDLYRPYTSTNRFNDRTCGKNQGGQNRPAFSSSKFASSSFKPSFGQFQT